MKPKMMKITKMYALMCEGTIAIAFGIMAPMLIGAIGLAMDVSQAYLVRQRLDGAVDAAALAAAATYEDEGLIAARVIDFITANYAPEEVGILDEENIEVDVTDNEVTVTASAIYPVTFMSIFGFNRLTVSSSVVVARELKGLEVVLVLDNTGSLVTGLTDNRQSETPIRAVRTAATNFVNILFSRVDDPEDIKIGIVPYASSVNVGRYGLGKMPDGITDYDTPFVTLPAGISYTANKTTTNQTGASWSGCIVEHMNNNYYKSDATPVTSSRGQLWSTTTGTNASRCMSQATCRGHGWDPGNGNNNPYPLDTTDNYSGPWGIYSYGYIIGKDAGCRSDYTCNRCSSSKCQDAYCWCSYKQPNTYCPNASVMPLTSDQSALLNLLRHEDSSGNWSPIMTAEGATYSNIGMSWGVKLLSQEEPFTEGSPWGDDDWNKAVVLMTDGEMSPGGDSSVYWSNNKSSSSNNINNLNNRLKEICTWLKADPRNVKIYTITFKHPKSDISEATRAIYRDCASEPKADHYFHAPSQAQLISAFERISGALANLHLKK